MYALWYALLAFMLTVYVILDGFDFGAGILHLFIAKSDRERRTVLAAIGPVWDGNEVWLVAFGGTLVFAFPRAYATAFSGFYLPLMMVLWLLVLRGVAIEFRSLEENPLWRSFWDAVFALASAVQTPGLDADRPLRDAAIRFASWLRERPALTLGVLGGLLAISVGAWLLPKLRD